MIIDSVYRAEVEVEDRTEKMAPPSNQEEDIILR